MQLERLKLFAQLIEHGSYSHTAEVLGVSKGYLSKQIKELEQELNCQLLIRNTRNMRLTPTGETLYQQAKPLTNYWSDTQELLRNNQESLAGSVSFTAPTGLVRHALMPAIEKLRCEQPEIELICDSGNQTHNLISTPYDFALRITNTPPEDMIAKKLISFDYICCASKCFIEKFGKPEHPKQLNNFKCISLSYWKAWQFEQGLAKETEQDKTSKSGKFIVNIEPQIQFSDNELLKAAAISGHGITRLPSYLIANELESGELVALFSEHEKSLKPLSSDIYLLYPPAINRPQRVQIVMDAINRQLESLQ